MLVLNWISVDPSINIDLRQHGIALHFIIHQAKLSIELEIDYRQIQNRSITSCIQN